MKRKHSDWSEPPGTGNWLLIDALSRVAWGMVESDSADLAIVGAPSEVELPLPRLSVVPFAGHPFEVIFPVGHPLGKVRKMGLCNILRYPLILAAEDSSSGLQFDHVVGEAGLPSQVNVVMTAGKVPSILNYVGLGMDVAVLTRSPAHPLTRSAIEAMSFPAVKKERAKVSVPRRCTNSPEQIPHISQILSSVDPRLHSVALTISLISATRSPPHEVIVFSLLHCPYHIAFCRRSPSGF